MFNKHTFTDIINQIVERCKLIWLCKFTYKKKTLNLTYFDFKYYLKSRDVKETFNKTVQIALLASYHKIV